MIEADSLANILFSNVKVKKVVEDMKSSIKKDSNHLIFLLDSWSCEENLEKKKELLSKVELLEDRIIIMMEILKKFDPL